MIKIYLSGHVGEIKYREYTKQRYSEQFELRDPLEEVEQRKINPKELVIFRQLGFATASKLVINEIVEGDIELLNSCNCLVAIMNVYSAGTIMEIRIAYDNDLPVYVIDQSNRFRGDVWIKYHTNVFFNSVDDCFDFLIDTY